MQAELINLRLIPMIKQIVIVVIVIDIKHAVHTDQFLMDMRIYVTIYIIIIDCYCTTIFCYTYGQ